jgi:hypothetical protein
MLTRMTEDDWAITLQVFAAAQSRRGFSSQIHLKTDFDEPPNGFHLTGGEVSDSTQLATSLDIGPDITPRAAMTHHMLSLQSPLHQPHRVDRLPPRQIPDLVPARRAIGNDVVVLRRCPHRGKQSGLGHRP